MCWFLSGTYLENVCLVTRSVSYDACVISIPEISLVVTTSYHIYWCNWKRKGGDQTLGNAMSFIAFNRNDWILAVHIRNQLTHTTLTTKSASLCFHFGKKNYVRLNIEPCYIIKISWIQWKISAANENDNLFNQIGESVDKYCL